jgi:hypothetical protein
LATDHDVSILPGALDFAVLPGAFGSPAGFGRLADVTVFPSFEGLFAPDANDVTPVFETAAVFCCAAWAVNVISELTTQTARSNDERRLPEFRSRREAAPSFALPSKKRVVADGKGNAAQLLREPSQKRIYGVVGQLSHFVVGSILNGMRNKH